MSNAGLPRRLYRAESVRELDRIAIEEHGIPGFELMSRAGRAAFDVLRQSWPEAKSVAVVCGVGNTAGDGDIVARLALEKGMDVRVADVGDPERLGGDARDARDALLAGGCQPVAFTPLILESAGVIVDAIFGTGLDREVEDHWAHAIECVNAADAPVLALDIPSGIHADSGRVMGTAVRANATVSFIALKQGMFTGSGRDYCGRIHFEDLGVPDDLYQRYPQDAWLDELEHFHGVLGPRSRGAHKGSFGHVLVIGGDGGFVGASRLAAEAALRCGAGLVSVATRTAHAHALHTGRPEIMAHGTETKPQLRSLIDRAGVLAIGPGLGRSAWAGRMLDAALQSGKPLVVDADGLNLLAEMQDRSLNLNCVVTPHPGEAGRLLGSNAQAVEADRFEALGSLIEKLRCACVLKGAGTLTSAPEADIYLCADGNPGMATGGMGDVLTGVIAALMAQGLSALSAARTGVCLHARAGDLAAGRLERGTLASDLMPHLRVLVNAI